MMIKLCPDCLLMLCHAYIADTHASLFVIYGMLKMSCCCP
uniref:Uncharacterized protein n=1 Tax=Arundo donax TaxID=35708 RepID=A0A0A8YPD9_ARUDO